MLALIAPRALAACGGRGTAGGGGGEVTSLRVLDYYNNEPDKTVYATMLDACGKQNGVTIDARRSPATR